MNESMKTYVANFPKQLAEAIDIGKNASLTKSDKTISNVLICGLGGSGIGASIIRESVIHEATVPIDVCKAYFIPSYVNENTLVILSSYSGNTEETLSCLTQALKKKAKIVTVTSGGKMAEMASNSNLDCILVPGGMPPRACLGYSITQLFFILGFHTIISDGFKTELTNAVSLIDNEENEMVAEAKELAKLLLGKTPIIYTTTNNEGLAIRLRQQLNENAKILCWHHSIPEMNHNELVGWTKKNDDLAVLLLLDRNEYSRNIARVGINKSVIEKYTNTISEVYSKGNSIIEQSIYFIHLGDWISVFLAELQGTDPIEVKVIDHLKGKLADIN